VDRAHRGAFSRSRLAGGAEAQSRWATSLYYLCLAAAIQRAGGPLPTMIIGTLPVVIAVSANLRDARRDGRLPWLRMLPSLALIALASACVNQSEMRSCAQPRPDLGRYATGALLAVGAVACWTWYPLRNADWLRAHARSQPAHLGHGAGPGHAAAGGCGLSLASGLWNGRVIGQAFDDALRPARRIEVPRPDAGHRPVRVLAGHAVLERGQPAPADHAGGQLIVFETLAALAYALWPGW
jgi:hypothetical protein